MLTCVLTACAVDGDAVRDGAPAARAEAAPEPVTSTEATTRDLPVTPVAEVSPGAELPDTWRRALAVVRPDPAPAQLVRDTHYWTSNELSHFVWRDLLVERGGVHVGLGTDQNYLLAGWSRPELIVLMDFDQGVVDLHRAYGALFVASESPEAFVASWHHDQREAADAIVRRHVDPEHVEAAVKARRRARTLVERRLLATLEQYRAAGIPTFLDDPAQYDHLRRLWLEGRVVAVRGDLTANRTMRDLGAALRSIDEEVDVLYLSNAEQYFHYTDAVRQNLLALPFAEDAVVLRTLGWKQFGYVNGEYYHYNAQGGRNLQTWVGTTRVSGAPAMLRYRTRSDVHGVSTLDTPPPPEKLRR